MTDAQLPPRPPPPPVAVDEAATTEPPTAKKEIGEEYIEEVEEIIEEEIIVVEEEILVERNDGVPQPPSSKSKRVSFRAESDTHSVPIPPPPEGEADVEGRAVAEKQDDSDSSGSSSNDNSNDSGSDSSGSDDDDNDSTTSSGSDSSDDSSTIPPPPPPPPPKEPKKRRALYAGARETPQETVQVIVEAPVVVSQEKIERKLKRAENVDHILKKIDDELDEKRNEEIKAKILEAEALERERAVKAQEELVAREKAAAAMMAAAWNANNNSNNKSGSATLGQQQQQESLHNISAPPLVPKPAPGIHKFYAQEGDATEGDVRVDRSLLVDLFDEEKEAKMQRREARRRRHQEEKRLRKEIKRKKKLMKWIQRKIRKKKKEQKMREKWRMLQEGECSNAVIIMEKVRGEIDDPKLERQLEKIAKKKRYNNLNDKDRKRLMRISKIDPALNIHSPSRKDRGRRRGKHRNHERGQEEEQHSYSSQNDDDELRNNGGGGGGGRNSKDEGDFGGVHAEDEEYDAALPTSVVVPSKQEAQPIDKKKFLFIFPGNTYEPPS